MYNVIRIMFDRAGSFVHFEITTVYYIFPSGYIYIGLVKDTSASPAGTNVWIS